MKRELKHSPHTVLHPAWCCMCVLVFFSHCLRSEDTIGWQKNTEKLTRDTKDRERKDSNAFLLLFLFSAPCFLCLPSSKLELGMSNPFPSRLDQVGAAEFTGGWSLRQKHTGPADILLMMTELPVLEYCVTKRTTDLKRTNTWYSICPEYLRKQHLFTLSSNTCCSCVPLPA